MMWPLPYRLFVSLIIESQGVIHFSTFLGMDEGVGEKEEEGNECKLGRGWTPRPPQKLTLVLNVP